MNNGEYQIIANENMYFQFNMNNDKKSRNILSGKNSHYWEKGSNTVVFSISNEKHSDYVLKVQRYDKDIIEEYINSFVQKYPCQVRHFG